MEFLGHLVVGFEVELLCAVAEAFFVAEFGTGLDTEEGVVGG